VGQCPGVPVAAESAEYSGGNLIIGASCCKISITLIDRRDASQAETSEMRRTEKF
jgi:hypothetical protein